MRRRGVWLAGLMIAIVAALLAGGALVAPGDVRATSSDGFDTDAALARLQHILGDQRPHPVDSAANDAVRDRLVAELRAIGLDPAVTDDFACNGSAANRTVSCARIRNVVATIGPREGRHLLLVSHYDSTPVGPGAADAGIGIAAMIEVAARLARGELKRPVTFLFNEGEEAGLIGARAFIGRNPLAGRVDTLLNFEARGVNGPAVMFETSRPNGAAIAALQRAVERPVANSMAVDFYRLLPNSTDVAVFEERGWTTLNFAVIGNETRYHSPGDDLEALDRRSVQHMGDQALALATVLGTEPPAAGAAEVTYTDVAGRTLLTLPLTLAYALLALLVTGFAIMAFSRKQGLGHAILAVLVTLFGSAALAYVMQRVIGAIRAGDYWRAYPQAVDSAVFAITVLVAMIVFRFVTPMAGAERLRSAFWLVLTATGGAAAIALPGSTMLFLPAAALALAAMVLGRWSPAAEQWLALAAAATLYVLWAPLLALVAMTLGRGSAWLFAPVASAIALPWLIEAKPLLTGHRKRALLPATGLAVAAWIVVALVPAYSSDRKQAFGIEYASTPDDARWLIASDGALPAELRAFTPGATVPWSTRPRHEAPAPAGLARAPLLERLEESVTPSGRLVSLRLSTNGAEWIMLRAPASADLVSVRAGGWGRRFGGRDAQPAQANDSDYVLRCHGRSCEGLRVDLLVGSQKTVSATLIGFSAALPLAAAPIVAARPSNAAPQYTPDMSVAVARVRL